MLRKLLIAAAAASVLAMTGCAVGPKTYTAPTAEQYAKQDARSHRFEYNERKSYANNLLNTMHHYIQVDDSRIPQKDFNLIGMAGTAYSVGGLATGMGSSFGLGLGLLMDLFTPPKIETWRLGVAMTINPVKEGSDKLTSLEESVKQLADASQAVAKEMGYETVQTSLDLRSAFANPNTKHMKAAFYARKPADQAGSYRWLGFEWVFQKDEVNRPAEKLPAWIDPKQPQAWVVTRIAMNRGIGYGGADVKSIDWRTDKVDKYEKDKSAALFYEKLQKRIPAGLYAYVPPFEIGKDKFTPPCVMTKGKNWFFVVPED